MEHDVKEGWCICGEYHKRGDTTKKPVEKASTKKAASKGRPKKASAPKAAPPPAKAKLEPIAEEMLPLDDEVRLKYPFGAPRIF